ncbi:dITP/XTP pyrophosphatase [Wigglesworthia glossinidia endosymbiont of Glossina morsitans morsitans (Yale colony)]|uniref:dITP/XTP pyrophosphatase n=1 Tax=Wigglesworthia glossinidia endosymbiont of Glossina morsitans morsitans (Yale colony) TaxID=1142511 RepID=H6Q5N8_WIGGL|nr:RdgB/HAM1 family non-canonical purine NTP pyrophosphatase [Wigglesworthia glossinidia]AFA40942.1 dITP/XTP pyrophosphatase [Wigglesworthia glossinidia endosymbiont of Glossina morsitans morsitans (Yale colony)]
MKKIILATTNQNKINEFKELLYKEKIEVISQKNLNIEKVVESAPTFIENALIKARHASKSGFPALADDSGLIIKMLNGKPGVYSSRFCGALSTDKSNIEKVLKEMSNFKMSERNAQLYCALAYVRFPEDPIPIVVEGSLNGVIAKFISKSKNGFGYDPIFFLINHNKMLSELTLKEKTRISHRSKAIKKMINKIIYS